MNMDLIKCCEKNPVVWECTCDEPCGCDVELIKCSVCNRVVYGADDDSREDWNNGVNDD